MGKDIHIHIEYSYKKKEKPQWFDSAIGEFTGARNWTVFFAKLLAAYGKRDLPKDISQGTLSSYREWVHDAHNCGYCSPTEFVWCVYNSEYENKLNEFMALEKFIEELGKNKRYQVRIVFWFDN